MTSPITSRADLMERLRTSTRDEVTLAEMQRLGFWPSGTGQPTVVEDLIKREAALSETLRTLSRQLSQIQDPVTALREMRKERMAKARARREETRLRRARERFERAIAWQERRARELLYLGEGVSAGLNRAQSDEQKLALLKLPRLNEAQDLASAMGIALPELRFLAFDRRVSRISHYRRFAMPKKTGGERIISAPMPRLKRAQYWVLDNLLARAEIHPAAHGFVTGRSIVSNALPHVGKDMVINLDLKNFFPSIAMPRIKGIFSQMGYSEQIATTLALLCTEAPTEEVSVDGETFFVAHGQRALPQGSPCSPALTNILCRRLDARLQGCAARLGFTYTRYADDLTFSCSDEGRKLAGKLLWRVKQIVAAEGLTPHPDKQHVMRSAQRQSVTGIVVNEKPAIERETLRRFRATLFQVEKDGPAGKQWNGNTNVIDALDGYAQFIKMVDAAKGMPLLLRVRQARAKWAGVPDKHLASTPAGRHSDFRALSAQGKQPWEGWWTPAVPVEPVLEKTAIEVKAERVELKKARTEAAQNDASRGQGPQRPGAQPQEAPGRALLKGRPWNAVMLQMIVAIFLAASVRSYVPLIVAVILGYQALRDYSAHWPRFIGIMAVVILLSAVLR